MHAGRVMTWPGVVDAVMIITSVVNCRAANMRFVSVVWIGREILSIERIV